MCCLLMKYKICSIAKIYLDKLYAIHEFKKVVYHNEHLTYVYMQIEYKMAI